MKLRQLQLYEIQNIQLDILYRVVKYCDHNHIKYFLAYGTLIGAIRHRGYIPWDDDIDIAMPRPDYEKFIQNFNQVNEKIKVHSNELDSKFLYQFSKVSNEETLIIENTKIKSKIGVNIDIFPIDGYRMNDTKLLKRQRNLKRLLNLKIINISRKRKLFKNIILLLGKTILFLVTIKNINSMMIKNSQTYSFAEEDYCCNISTGDMESPLPKKYFEEQVLCKFEGKQYYTSKYYHEWLKIYYGNYMELPSEEEQRTHHDYAAYIKKDVNE